MTNKEKELTEDIEALKAFVSSLHIELQQLQKLAGVKPLHWWAGLYQRIHREQPDGLASPASR